MKKISMPGYENTISIPGTVELVLEKTYVASATQGTMDDNDDILAIAFKTDETANVGDVKINLSKIGVVVKRENSTAQHVLYNYSNNSGLLRAVANSF